MEDTNLKLGDVVSDVMGKAAQLILQAVVEGESDPVRLASLAVGRVQASQQQLERALTGKVTVHHRFMLGQHLALIKHLDEVIRRVTEEIARRFIPPEPPAEQQHPSRPTDAPLSDSPEATPASGEAASLSWQEAVELIDQVTGISQRVAQGLLAEIGIEMDQFPSAKHQASWVGICPGNHESAGKRLSGKTRKGNPYPRQLLIQAAHAAAHSKNTYLAAQYRCIAARRGPKRAAVAVGHSILVIVYHLLRDRGTYQDLGGNYFDEHDRQMVQKHLVRRLERLGYQVDLQPRSEAG